MSDTGDYEAALDNARALCDALDSLDDQHGDRARRTEDRILDLYEACGLDSGWTNEDVLCNYQQYRPSLKATEGPDGSVALHPGGRTDSCGSMLVGPEGVEDTDEWR